MAKSGRSHFGSKVTKHTHHQGSNNVVGKQGHVNPSQKPRSKETWREKESDISFFPDWTIWVLHAVTIATRLYMVSRSSNWWLLHPDEVYQSIEVAHSEVYGYGFRPYEYLPPPQENSTSPVDQQEVRLGMYSLRSFLYPRIYIMWLTLLEAIGSKINPFLGCKLLHGFVAAHLPLSVYMFCKQFFMDGQLATLAAILVASSEQLVVLGTHSFVNSFLSPLVFVCLAVICREVRKVQHDAQYSASEETKGNKTAKSVSGHQSADERVSTGCLNGLNGARFGDIKSSHLNTGVDYNGNCQLKEHFCINNTPSTGAKRDRSGGKLQPGLQSTNSTFPNFALFGCGFLLGLLIYIRCDLLLFVTVLGFVICPVSSLTRHPLALGTLLLKIITGFGLAVLIDGMEDRLRYGSWFMSSIQWIKFNVLRDVSSKLFGKQDNMKYLKEMFNHDLPSQILTVTFVICLAMHKNAVTGKILRSRIFRLLCALGILIFIYSWQKHKEIRFIHNVLVLYYISGAAILFSVCTMFSTKRVFGICIHASLLCHMAVTYSSFPNPGKHNMSKWTYMQVDDSHYINECLYYVSQQNDVTGVYVDRSLHYTAGYSILHQNVPLLVLVHLDLNEFDIKARKILPKKGLFSSGVSNVSVIGRASNFFTQENQPLISQYLVTKTEYNYLLVRVNHEGFDGAFHEVFRSGTMKVLRRDDKNNDVSGIKPELATPKANGTLLEYEGSWLVTYGLYDLADSRLRLAIRQDPARIRAYQLLAVIYQRQNKSKERDEILKRCYDVHGKQICSVLQPKVVIHDKYQLQSL